MFGRKFGKLTVIGKEHIVKKNGKKYWNTRCDCGNEKIIYEYCLTSGGTKTCNNCYGSQSGKVGYRSGKLTIIKYRIKKDGRYYYPTKCECGNPETIFKRTDCIFSKNNRENSCGKCVEYDLIAKRFDRWIIYSYFGRNNKKTAMYRTMCDCGNIGIVSRDDLLGKRSKSCGCIASEKTSDRFSYNLEGKCFGRLVILRRTHKDGWNNWRYTARCDCGNIKENIKTAELIKGKIKSCGCYSRELARDRLLGKTREKNYKWNPNKTDEERLIQRNTEENLLWVKYILELYDYKCDICGSGRKTLNAHHLYSYHDYENLRFCLDNGVALCSKHHTKFHKSYGYGKNTPEQYHEFKRRQSL